MNKMIQKGLAATTLLALLTGCGQNVPLVVNNMNNEDKCDAYNKQLLKVDEYLEVVNRRSAFHLEEAAVALQNPQISTSNNKKDMLKDATKRRNNIVADMQANGCKSYKEK